MTDNNHKDVGDHTIFDGCQEQTQVSSDTNIQFPIPSKVREIAQQIRENNTEHQETVRTILTWFKAKRNSHNYRPKSAISSTCRTISTDR